MKNVPYVVCAFHTDDEIYNAEIGRLRASLETFELPHEIRTIKSGHRWKDVCRMKPQFIADMLSSNGGKDVLYLDADAVVLQHPTLFDHFAGDLGVVLRPPGELFASTIYVKNSHYGLSLVAEWIQELNKDTKSIDQTLLQRVVDRRMSAGGIVSLPWTYAHKFAERDSGAVIGQYQASRKVRAKAGGAPI
jgi:hypothetical protein